MGVTAGVQNARVGKQRSRPAARGSMTEISLRFEPPFARIVLIRPERRNAITRAMWRALPAIRAAIEDAKTCW